MSKKPMESDDWSGRSEALFRAARAEHAPSAADRARVRSALAQRLAGSAVAPATGDHAPVSSADGGVGAAITGKVVKIGLGVACVVAGAVAFVSLGDAPRPGTRKAEPANASQAAPPPSAVAPVARPSAVV
ncbi:MAG TPA: hypothetical protein VJR89_10695, partial [Polyangiales bacterium]|nr:hypothetical protein [Polyangiales bacterium]